MPEPGRLPLQLLQPPLQAPALGPRLLQLLLGPRQLLAGARLTLLQRLLLLPKLVPLLLQLPPGDGAGSASRSTCHTPWTPQAPAPACPVGTPRSLRLPCPSGGPSPQACSQSRNREDGGSGRGPPAGLSHLQDLLVQGAFVLRQRLHQAGHLGQRVPLLHPLRLQPGHQQLQVSVAALGLGRGGRAAVTLRAPQGGALGFWRWDRSEPPSWRCASRSSGRDRAEGVPQEGGPRVLRLPSEVKGCLRGH